MTKVIPILLIVLIATGCTCVTPLPNQPPTAYIDSITPVEASPGTKVTFEGHGTDADGTVVAYRWRSSIDGELSTKASFETSSLSEGKHTIYFKVRDNNGSWSEDVGHTVTVKAAALPVVASFDANPGNIAAGQSSALSWNVSGATTVTIEPVIGSVALTGTRNVSPTTTTTYTLTATNEAGNTTATVQVVVSALPGLPVINSFTATPESIAQGGSSTLSWNVSSATAVDIDQGIGTVDPHGGTKVVSPAATTTYTLTATNQAGSTTATVKVIVTTACPTGQFLAEYYTWTPPPDPPIFSGQPVFSRCEDSINYDWGTSGPGQGIPNDYFMARWTGTFSFDGGDYTFIAKVDDGVRLWFDGSLIIDQWKPQAVTEYRVTRDVSEGNHEVKVEYFERMGAAVCQVRWEKYSLGKIIFERGGEIWVMEPDGTSQARVGTTGASKENPAWSPNGTMIAFDYYLGGKWDIYLMNADGGNETRLTTDPALDKCPTWSPDGTKIAFHSNRDGNFEIYVMNANGSDQTRLTNNPAADSTPAWSPDGTKIAFASNRDGNSEIYVMNADGTNQTRLTNNTAAEGSPAWSPDGTKIAFDSNRDGNSDIYVMNTDGTNQTRFTNHPAGDLRPAWSPDGTKIAFQSDRDGNSDIYVMNTDGTNQTRFTNHPAGDLRPAWSPDGTKIAFQSDRDGNWEIYVMNVNGTNQTRLTNYLIADNAPDWQ